MTDASLPKNASDLLDAVRAKIAAESLNHGQAAAQIGVTLNSLENHLRGEHVRSDSQAKYRRWLSGQEQSRTSGQMKLGLEETDSQAAEASQPVAPAEPVEPPGEASGDLRL